MVGTDALHLDEYLDLRFLQLPSNHDFAFPARNINQENQRLRPAT